MTTKSYNKDRFNKLVSKEPSGFIKAQAASKVDRKKKLRSFKVALSVLEILDYKKMSQATLAKKVNVTPQQISKWLKGKSNMTFETIEKLEDALGFDLITVPKIDFEREAKNNKFVMKKMAERTIKAYARNQEITHSVTSKDDFHVRRPIIANTYSSIIEANKNLRPTG